MMTKETKRYSMRKRMMFLSLTITLTALVLCGAIFAVSVWMIMDKYISEDINFFLLETGNNLNSNTEYLENVIYQIRYSDDLMNFLGNSKLESKSESRKYYLNHYNELQDEFNGVVDISSSKNTEGSNFPLVEKVYLFDETGNYFQAFYYAMVYQETEKSDEIFQQIWKNFQEYKRKEPSVGYKYYVISNELVYLAFTLYDNDMEEIGTVIYELKTDVIHQLLFNVDNYQQVFWTLYDEKDMQITNKNIDFISADFQKISHIRRDIPYSYKVGNNYYRLYTKKLCMDLRITIGVLENQTFALMYDSVKIYVAIVIFIGVTVSIAFIYVIYFLTKPLKVVTDNLALVQNGNYTTKLPDYSSMEFHEISQVFNDMTTNIDYLVNQVYEKQITIKEMEIKFLQAQMNPHFMFNILNTIALQSKMDKNEEVFKMITSFSQLVQAKIYRKDNEKVHIRKELEYVEYYLYLQSYRYGEKLSYAIDIKNKELVELYIPKLCIQLIVENAVVHGIEPKMENGIVQVKIYDKDGDVYIDTIDNGVGFEKEGKISLPIEFVSKDKGHNHVGLNNAFHIIKLMYGKEYGINIKSSKEFGTCVSIHIPFDYGEQKETGS